MCLPSFMQFVDTKLKISAKLVIVFIVFVKYIDQDLE